MEPKFQTSFIPKSSFAASNQIIPQSIGSISLLPLIGGVVFVASLLTSGGLFAYEKILNRKITELNDSIILVKKDFDPDVIKQLSVASDQIQSAKNLLHKHVAVSNMFALLQSKVLPNVRFISFNFTQNNDGTVNIAVDGEGQSYEVVAQQSDIFNKINYLKNQNFTSLDLTEKGLVTIKFQADVDQSLISYSDALKSMISAQTNSVSTIPSSTIVSTTSPVRQP